MMRSPKTAVAGLLILLMACGGVVSTPTVASVPPNTTDPPAAVHTTGEASGTAGAAADIPQPRPGESLVARTHREVAVFPWPGAPEPSRLLEATTILGTPRTFLVSQTVGNGWLEVALPVRPNGSTGWVQASEVELGLVDTEITVSLSRRRLVATAGGETVIDSVAGIGSLANPTPTGRFYVTDVVQLADPASAWGPYALGLSAFSDTITEFNGGDGIIGIHGTNRPATIGRAASLGCVRLPNDVITELARIIPLGTPVEITA